MTHVATCPECQKSFKVPHFEKTWSCKHCQVALVPTAPEVPPKVSPEFASCEECGAVLPDKADECPECGVALNVDRGNRARESATKARNKPLRASSSEGRHARSEARKLLAKLDWLGVALLVLAGLAILELVVLGSYLTLALTQSTDLPPLLLIMIGATIVQLLLYLVARNSITSPHGRPFVWVVILAGIACSVAILDVWKGPILGFPSYVDHFFRDVSDGAWPWGVVRSVIALGLVVCINPASRINRIRNDHPEAFENELEPGSASRSLRKRDQQRAQGSQRVIMITASLLAVLAIGAIVMWMSGQPTSPKGTIAQFKENWNAGNVEAMAGMTASKDRARWEKRIARRMKKYGWEESTPALGEFLWDKNGADNVTAAYAGEDGGLEVRFRWQNERWELVGLDYSNLVP